METLPERVPRKKTRYSQQKQKQNNTKQSKAKQFYSNPMESEQRKAWHKNHCPTIIVHLVPAKQGIKAEGAERMSHQWPWFDPRTARLPEATIDRSRPLGKKPHSSRSACFFRTWIGRVREDASGSIGADIASRLLTLTFTRVWDRTSRAREFTWLLLMPPLPTLNSCFFCLPQSSWYQSPRPSPWGDRRARFEPFALVRPCSG